MTDALRKVLGGLLPFCLLLVGAALGVFAIKAHTVPGRVLCCFFGAVLIFGAWEGLRRQK